MPGTDAALLTAEEMLALYARRALSPVEVLQAVTERIARLNPGAERLRRAEPARAGGRRRERGALAGRPSARPAGRRAHAR